MNPKYSIFLLLVLLSMSAHSKEICADFKPNLAERDKDSDFTKESALNAVSFLKMHIEKDSGLDPWSAPMVIEGYFYKRDAEAEIKNGSRGEAYTTYCNFVTRQGVHRD